MNAHTANTTGNMVEHALEYARRGLPVFPCNPSSDKDNGKQPLIPRDKDDKGEPIPKTGGLYKATTDKATIQAWWRKWPNALIGLRMGLGSGLFAIDPDRPKEEGDPDGLEAWQQLAAEHRYTSDTHTHLTPGGGMHLVFAYPEGLDITNSSRQLPKGIDVRGEGGYVIAWPSRLTDGRSYRLEEPSRAYTFASPPAWLLDQLKKPEPKSKSEKAKANAKARGGRIHQAFADEEGPDPFWKNVNSLALANLDAWVPKLIPAAQRAGGGIWRVKSCDLGRDLQEDLGITPDGIKDWGVWDLGDPNEGKRTPIALVLEYNGASTPAKAALWLCQRIGADPASLGWRGGAHDDCNRANGNGHANDQADEFAEQPRQQQQHAKNGADRNERSTIAHQGVLVPTERDRLDIAQKLAAAPPFPVEHLPPVMRGAVEALQEHMQAPRPLCAHSILSTAMLVSQGLADIEIGPLGSATPLSLFMLVVAVSGERKSACDNLALVAVAQHEEMLRRDYEDDLKDYKAAKAAHDAERRAIERNGKINASERRQQLLELREPEAPLLPVMRAKEPNLEGLLNLLANGHASVGIFTSEGGQYLGGHGMGEDARTRNITGLSELWDSGSAQRIRAKETAFLHGRRVGISLAAQPKIASSLLCDELARDQGFVGRFLITMPDSTIGTRQIKESRPLDDQRLQAFHRQCRIILEAPLPLRDGRRNEVDPPALRLTAEAWEVWRALAQSIEDDCRQDGLWMPVRSAALKMAENVARIAGILTVFEDANAATRRGGTVSGESMAAAASIGLFYLREALRLTGHSALDPETRALQEMAEWLTSEKVGAGTLVNPTKIQRLAPNHLRTDAATTQARIRRLVEFGVLDHVGRAEIDGKSVREAYRVTTPEGGK